MSHPGGPFPFHVCQIPPTTDTSWQLLGQSDHEKQTESAHSNEVLRLYRDEDLGEVFYIYHATWQAEARRWP